MSFSLSEYTKIDVGSGFGKRGREGKEEWGRPKGREKGGSWGKYALIVGGIDAPGKK